ncbi:MAG: IMP dehydrogenase [Fimbriimonadia bacterium]|nr:IMP dehydrogenase [Fimbriimonadia bacterium]
MSHAKFTEALSFDDVLLLPQHSDILPDEVDTSTILLPNIKLKTPIVSSPMDTVTESRLAIALAREGGVGVIHRNMSMEAQAEEVDRVKRSEHGIIWNPISLSPDHTIQDALQMMERYHISGVPITDGDEHLVGILTNRDIRFETDFNRLIREVMTGENLIIAPVGTTLEQAEEILQKYKIEKLPIVDEDGRLRGLITIKDLLKIRHHPFATKDDRGRLIVGAAVGPLRQPVERAKMLWDAGVDFVVVDAAHGHSEGVLEAIRAIKRAHPDLPVIGGNVASAEGIRALVEAGAQAARVGLGAGSICTTRVVSGVGVPQLYAVMECAEEAAKRGIALIADGGIRYSGDIVKALAAGASCVMLGNLLAGCEESPGETEIYRNRAYKVYRGMGSVGAMRSGSSDRYYQKDPKRIVPEGVEGRVPFKGSLADIVYQLVGGLRSGMGYLGAKDIKTLQKRARFVRITNSGLRESHPHSISITREPPNYSSEWSGESE